MADGILSRKTRNTPSFRRVRFALYLAFVVVTLTPGLLDAQAARVEAESEVFRKNPDGRRLGTLQRGARLNLARTEGDWAEVTLEGWVPTTSLGPTSDDGFDRVVTRAGGQALHSSPDGPTTGQLLRGFLLFGVQEADGWTRVRRTGWVYRPSLSFQTPGLTRDTTAVVPPPPAAVVAEGRRVAAGPDSIRLRGAPGGQPVAVVEPGTGMTVVSRSEGWTRVRVEGWVPSSELVGTDPESVLADVSAAALRASPDQYEGLRVRWVVQFISLERAEPERTDFYEDEPFLLVRAPNPDEGFVYIAVPPELLPDAGKLEPLQTVDVLAQVRTGRSALMGVPVLDLLALF